MAGKKKRRKSRSPGLKILRGNRLPTLGDLKVPAKGLLDPALRSDLPNIPGLAKSRK